MDDHKMLTVPEVAGALRLSPTTVYRRITRGAIPVYGRGEGKLRIPAAWLHHVLTRGSEHSQTGGGAARAA
ncbi:MAG: helix-turn-helix domain-containing protein [Bryobacteraceae bacterium]